MNFKDSKEYQKIFQFDKSIENRIISRESTWLEFKESFNWGSKAKYAKTLAAFVNNRGGYLVFGVSDNPRNLKGLQTGNFENMDERNITEYLNSVFSPEIQYEKFIVSVRKKRVGVIFVQESNDKPTICLKPDDVLKEAEIYYRYNARSEKIKFPELKTLLDNVREKESEKWSQLFKSIAKIGPTNAAVLNVVSHEIIGQESMSIQITDSVEAPEFRLEEKDILKNYPLTYAALITEMKKRYSDFKLNRRFHKIRKPIMQNPIFCWTRYLDPKNTKSSKKDFYSYDIFKEFDKHYISKKSISPTP